MPPRHAYWTILIGQSPTAFRAREIEELRPTFERLREKHPDAVMKWFARGRLWSSPEESRDAGRRPMTPPEVRTRDWRPGGTHRDPRDRFKKPRTMHPARAKKRQTAKPGFEHDAQRDRGRPRDDARGGDRSRGARFGTASPERKRSPTGDLRRHGRDGAQFGKRKPTGTPGWRGAPRRDGRRPDEHQRDRRGAVGRSPHPRGDVKPRPDGSHRDARPRGPVDRTDGGRSDRRAPSGPRPDRPRREWQRPPAAPVEAPRDEREERKRNADGARLVKKVRR